MAIITLVGYSVNLLYRWFQARQSNKDVHKSLTKMSQDVGDLTGEFRALKDTVSENNTETRLYRQKHDMLHEQHLEWRQKHEKECDERNLKLDDKLTGILQAIRK